MHLKLRSDHRLGDAVEDVVLGGDDLLDRVPGGLGARQHARDDAAPDERAGRDDVLARAEAAGHPISDIITSEHDILDGIAMAMVDQA